MNNYSLKSVFSIIVFIQLTYSNNFNCYSQTRDSLLRIYNNETIQSYGKFYVKGSKQLKFGELKPEFNSGITKDLYKKSKGNLTLGRIFTVSAIGALVSSAIIKKNNDGAAVALNIVAIGLNLSSFRFRKKSTELIDRSIWQRNKEILFGVR